MNSPNTKIQVQEREWWGGKRVLITGASGFKGSWLSQVLLRLGAEVYGTTSKRINPMSAYHLFDLNKHIVQVDSDISNRQQVFDMLNSVAPDVIFHLAAKAQVPVANRDPVRTFDVNIMGTINILEGCRQLGVGRRLLIISTDHVFGHIEEGEFPVDGFDERSRVSYGGPYDTSKSAMELCVRSYHNTYWSQLPAVGITRAANVFGYGDVGTRRVIPLFINTALFDSDGIPLKYRKNGRQFIHVTDVVAGYIRAAASLNDDDPKLRDFSSFPIRSPFTPTFHFAIEDYNRSNEPFVRMKELGEMVASICKGKLYEAPDCVDYAPNENPVQALNCQKTQQHIGWSPHMSLEEGITRLRDWYLKKDQINALLSMLEEDVQKILRLLT
ncbi:MAG: GDP-mannose 4,6-dehydratase [Anaerolineae bacterium]|nr:GDP-mannose 4,6-dehydratase [Anaerolineae bacterium]